MEQNYVTVALCINTQQQVRWTSLQSDQNLRARRVIYRVGQKSKLLFCYLYISKLDNSPKVKYSTIILYTVQDLKVGNT